MLTRLEREDGSAVLDRVEVEAQRRGDGRCGQPTLLHRPEQVEPRPAADLCSGERGVLPGDRSFAVGGGLLGHLDVSFAHASCPVRKSDRGEYTLPMSATSRYRLDPAPGGLLLVQDLLNTCGVHAYAVRDLLGTVTDAQRWARTVVPTWRAATAATGSPGRLSSAALPGLRALRLDVARSLSGRPVTTAAQVDLLPGPAGVRVQPSGTGVAWLSG